MNPHEPIEDADRVEAVRRARLMRTGLLTAGIIGLHNLPEGMAVTLELLG